MRLTQFAASFAKSRELKLESVVAFASFIAAASILAWRLHWAWQASIACHAELVNRVPVEATIVGRHIIDDAILTQGAAIPFVEYEYVIDGRSYRSSVIRHAAFTRTNADESDVGTIRFNGPDRLRRAEECLHAYPIGASVIAWVNAEAPHNAMLIRQALDVDPFILGLIPAIFVPFLWVFFVLFLRVLIGRPASRWAACGWGLLTLAGLYPVFERYRRLLEPASFDVFARLLLVGMGLAATSVATSLLPRRPRAAIAVVLILSFTIVGGAGMLIATLCSLLRPRLGWKLDPVPIFVFSMEMALAGGVILGVIVALAIWKGLIVIYFNSPSEQPPIHKNS